MRSRSVARHLRLQAFPVDFSLPTRADRRRLRLSDRGLQRTRHGVENCFAKLKQHRTPAEPDALLRQSRTYPLHDAEPDDRPSTNIASDLDFARLVAADSNLTANETADAEGRDGEEALLRRSSLFDAPWYLATNDDVRASGMAPIAHYLRYGRHEGRRPGPDFDGSEYLRSYPDVASAGMDPLIHYLRYGRHEGRRTGNPYPAWVERHGVLAEDDRAAIRHHSDSLSYRPLISVIVPAFMTPREHLSAMVESVRAQLYESWELCIVDDGSPEPAFSRDLRALAERDARIRIAVRAANGGISAASNDALAIAGGDFVALLDHDDILHESALYEVVAALNDRSEVDILFSDSDEIDDVGYRSNPYMKGGWNPELLLGHNLVSHFGVYRRSLVERIGGFRPSFDGSQDYDLCLRATAATGKARIRHIPAVLYHWRRTRTDTSFSQTRHAQCISAASSMSAFGMAAMRSRRCPTLSSASSDCAAQKTLSANCASKQRLPSPGSTPPFPESCLA